MQNPKIIRKAFLIGAPGRTEDDYLPGVRSDLINFKNFLCSDRGGAWYRDEVLVCNNATSKNISLIRELSEKTDYSLIYFSGHGYVNYSSNQFLCLQDKPIPSSYLLTNCLRQVFIGDTCRRKSIAIGAIPPTGDYFSFTGPDPEIRKLFDEQILRSSFGKTVIFGARIGQEARESASGGDFTKTLLHVGRNMVTTSGQVVSTIGNVMSYVPKVLETKGSVQRPCIYSSIELTLPFAIAMPKQKHTTIDSNLNRSHY